MTIEIVPAGGQYVVRGVTSDPKVTAPLGRICRQVGPHTIGWDDNFAEPILVHAYYDPSADPAAQRAWQRGDLAYVGYMQFMQLSFCGMTIPPQIYGGRLADRTPYVYGDDQRVIDFMGPAQANVYGIDTPLYPYNALLVNTRDHDHMFYHPLENGSLWTPQDLGAGQSLVASLAGEISVGLVTPAALEGHLEGSEPILNLRPTAQQLATTEPYRLALDNLETAGPLAGLDETKVAAQMVGSYVLLTLPDPENLGDTLVISTASTDGATSVVVRLLTAYDMEDLFGQCGRNVLNRIRDYQVDQGYDFNDQQTMPLRGRGQSGLNTPVYDLSPDDVALELQYWTAAVAVGTATAHRRVSTLSAITWKAWFHFNEDTGEFGLATIVMPEQEDGYPLIRALRAFRLAKRQYANATIDTSNFTLAAMRRDNFAGPKLDPTEAH